ncbi:MAG: hydroxyectoine utilization dehydratase EutB [Anaerolineaceae bacterium 4572_32.2]|nr:MAG: hydroxyectoine utilization dehydratase EutB [Anaerolineaceae bacterium 4572_32.2]HEY73303.1 threonine/serine dehydratase [Thermoflexia bacterium]
MPASNITLRDIYLARQKIAPIANKTPLIHSGWLAERADVPVYLKLENVQETCSFKIRGAANKLLNLAPDERERGVITVSSGNHGRAVSYVARRLKIRAVVLLSEAVPEVKRRAIQKLGAEVIVRGETYDQAMEHASRLQKDQGLVMIHPFDDPLVIAGQGVIGLELLEDLPEIDTAIVPLSGGGLMGGIALALKTAHPGIRTVGVSMERGPAMVESLRAGRVVDIVEQPTIADGLAGGIAPNIYTFDIIQKYVDDTVLVSEEEIAGAMAFALEKHHLVVEGAGAVGIAALLYEKVERLGQHVAVVVSGGNVDLSLLLEIAERNRRKDK